MSNEPIPLPQALDLYARHGIHVTPVSRETKNPRLRKWNERPGLTASEFKLDDNIGVLLGAQIGTTEWRIYDVDVDTNSDAARRLVWALLPETGCHFGREGKPRSHGVFACREKLAGKKYLDTTGKASIEFRGLTKDLQKFTQTVFPGSVHSSGEPITFCGSLDAMGQINGPALFEGVRLAAVALVMLEVWPTINSRHDAAGAFAGYLRRAGLGADQISRMIGQVAKAAGDDEVDDRARFAADTLAKLEKDDTAHMTGGRWIAENVERGRQALAAINKILDIDDGGSIRVEDTSSAMIDYAWEALAKANNPPGMFLRGDKVVILPEGPHTVLRDAYRKQIELKPPAKYLKRVPGFRDLDVDLFRDLVSRVAVCTKPVRQSRVPCALPADFANLMLASPFLPLPEVLGFTTVPFFAPDGSLVTDPGLHAESGMFYCPDPHLALPEIPLRPTTADVAEALHRIDDLVWQFPFSDREFPFSERRPEEYRRTAYAHSLAFVMTVLTRGMMGDIVPVFLFDKPKARTGASLLVQCLSYLILGDWPAECEWDSSQTERRKFLTSVMVTGTPIVFLDDVTDLNSADLRKVVTGASRKGRELGKTNILDAPNVSTFASTGNNVAFDTQMANRICRVRLDANVPHPEDRTDFAIVPKQWVPQHRAELLWSFYVLVQNWIAAGRKEWTDDKLAGFETWSRTIGGILNAAGVKGFLGDRKDVRDDADDDDTDTVFDGRFLDEWVTQFGSQPVSIATLISKLTHVPETNGERWTSARLGPYLRDQRDRWRPLEDGRLVRIERMGGTRGLWFLRVRGGADRAA